MADRLSALLLWTLAATAYGPASELLTPDPPLLPYFTGCRSRELETFRCWWSVGSFSELSAPGSLAVFFKMEKLLHPDWHECPEYTASVQNECYFNKTYTHIWTPYCVELRSTAYNITYDSICFTVENIVYPDPPVALNWTLLNLSRSGLNFDILVRWAPPPSAAVQMGWMNLKYEVQYQPRNSSRWEKLYQESGTQMSIYGLSTDREYEVRVRCTMVAFDNFGEFSDSIFVQVAETPGKETLFSVTLLLVFGGVGLLLLILLIILSQQERLLVILLPPVPAPKIKGIDPELLKKGKMDQLDSLLRSQNMCKPDFASEDPWVEFIQLNLDDALEKSENSDTQHLLTHLSSAQTHGSSHALGLKGDDDSGRASCYDPDLGLGPEGLPTVSLQPGHSVRKEHHPLGTRSSSSTPILSTLMMPEAADTHSPVQTQPSSQSWINMDFYAQVSDVTPGGGVMLSQSSTPSKNPEKKKKMKEEDAGEEEEKEKKGQLQLLVVDSGGGYSSEMVARQHAATAPSCRAVEQAYHIMSEPPQSHPQAWQGGYLTPDQEPHMPYFSPEHPPDSLLPPVSDYTVVQDVGSRHHLLLHSSAPQTAVCPPHPLKHPPQEHTPPMAYLTPELLENFSP